MTYSIGRIDTASFQQQALVDNQVIVDLITNNDDLLAYNNLTTTTTIDLKTNQTYQLREKIPLDNAVFLGDDYLLYSKSPGVLEKVNFKNNQIVKYSLNVDSEASRYTTQFVFQNLTLSEDNKILYFTVNGFLRKIDL